jgi:hypothetical protein
MQIDNELANQRLADPNNLANRFSSNTEILVKERRGRSHGLSAGVKEQIAFEVLAGGRSQTEVAAEYGVGDSTVSQIKKDASKVARVEQVHDVAFDRLMATLGFITDDKLSGLGADKLSSVAANLGRVVEKSAPKTEEDDRVRIVIMAPAIRPQDKYTVIDIEG